MTGPFQGGKGEKSKLAWKLDISISKHLGHEKIELYTLRLKTWELLPQQLNENWTMKCCTNI
jgi:hypothetical protein